MEEKAIHDTKEWQDAYRLHFLEHGEPPASVYAFCAHIGIGEDVFFGEYSSLEALEADIWSELIGFVRQTLKEDGEYADYSPHQKALTFFYTFLEAMKAQRSWYLARFPREYPSKDPEFLDSFRKEFMGWAKEVSAEDRDGPVAKRLKADRWMALLLYAHFRSIIKFSLEDKSPGFERTDAYVEKSTRLFFDLADTRVADSAIDFLRFMTGRK